MIVHPFQITEGGPAGLFGTLEAHEFERPLAVEGEAVAWSTECQVEECPAVATYLLTIHRLHSRRESEQVGLCVDHMVRHRGGEALRIRVESHR